MEMFNKLEKKRKIKRYPEFPILQSNSRRTPQISACDLTVIRLAGTHCLRVLWGTRAKQDFLRGR